MGNRAFGLITIAIICLVMLTLMSNDEVETSVVGDQQVDIHLENDEPTTKFSAQDGLEKKTVKQDQASPEIDIFECIPDNLFAEEKWAQNSQNYIQSLGATDNRDDALSYALFSDTDDVTARLDLLLDFESKYPSNPIVNLNILTSCLSVDDKRCTPELVNSAIDADSDNGAIWFAAASLYVKREQDSNVRMALNELAQAPQFSERYAQTILLYAQAFQGSEYEKFNLNVIDGIGRASGKSLWYGSITKWCNDETRSSRDSEACLILGVQLETRGTTYISHAVGLSIQKHAFEVSNDEAGLKRIQLTRDEYLSSVNDPSFQKMSIMMMLDERLLRHWLEGIDTVGEEEAFRSLADEAEMLYDENENMLCTLVYDAIGFLE